MPKEEKIKFTQEELDQISEYRQKYLDVQMGFGQAEITDYRLQRQYENLDKFTEDLKKQFDDIQEEEQKFIAAINEKYGDGVLDPDTGVFTPNTSQNTWKNSFNSYKLKCLTLFDYIYIWKKILFFSDLTFIYND